MLVMHMAPFPLVRCLMRVSRELPLSCMWMQSSPLPFALRTRRTQSGIPSALAQTPCLSHIESFRHGTRRSVHLGHEPLSNGNLVAALRSRGLKCSALGQHQSQARMDLGLERLPRDALPVDADVAVLLVLGYDPVSRDLLVVDQRVLEEAASGDREEQLQGLGRRYVAPDGDEIHVSVVDESSREEIRVGGHVCHL